MCSVFVFFGVCFLSLLLKILGGPLAVIWTIYATIRFLELCVYSVLTRFFVTDFGVRLLFFAGLLFFGVVVENLG